MINWTDSSLIFNNKTVFKDLNLNIKRDEKVLFNSRSGSGKTSLLKTAIGLCNLDSGTINIDGVLVSPKSIQAIRSKIFYLDQDVSLPEIEVDELLQEIMSYKANKDINFFKQKLNNYLDEFYLSKEILTKNIKDLSGGERQRIGLIVGFLLNRPIWFLDEPTSALDNNMKNRVKNSINKLNITALIISHDSCWNDLKKVCLGEYK